MKNIGKRIVQSSPFYMDFLSKRKKEASFEKYWKKLYNVKVWSDFEISF